MSNFLLKKFICGPLQNNFIILGCEETKKAVIIDPAIESFVKGEPFVKEKGFFVEKILLTHSHWDHEAEVFLWKERVHASVCLHENDAANLEFPRRDGLFTPIELVGISADHFLKDNEEIAIGYLSLQVLHTPGHSSGSVCFYLEEQGILFSGDTLFKGSMGALHFPSSQPSSMIASLKRLSALPPSTRVIPGHGAETTIGAESWLSCPEKFCK